MTTIRRPTTLTYVSNSPRPRTLTEIAEEIADDWDPCPERVEEITDTLRTVETIHDVVHEGTAGLLVREFLKLSGEWQGNTAKRIRHELRGKLGLN